MLAANRNMLQQQKANLKTGLERLPVAPRQNYMEQIQNLDNQIESSKRWGGGICIISSGLFKKC